MEWTIKKKNNNKRDSNGKQEIISGSKEIELIVEKGTSCCILRKHIDFSEKQRRQYFCVSRILSITNLKKLKPF